jgi:hypothetical protein
MIVDEDVDGYTILIGLLLNTKGERLAYVNEELHER